jgi:hypothetical protein
MRRRVSEARALGKSSCLDRSRRGPLAAVVSRPHKGARFVGDSVGKVDEPPTGCLRRRARPAARRTRAPGRTMRLGSGGGIVIVSAAAVVGADPGHAPPPPPLGAKQTDRHRRAHAVPTDNGRGREALSIKWAAADMSAARCMQVPPSGRADSSLSAARARSRRQHATSMSATSAGEKALIGSAFGQTLGPPWLHIEAFLARRELRISGGGSSARLTFGGGPSRPSRSRPAACHREPAAERVAARHDRHARLAATLNCKCSPPPPRIRRLLKNEMRPSRYMIGTDRAPRRLATNLANLADPRSTAGEL